MNQPTIVQTAHVEGAGSGTTVAVTLSGVTQANGIIGSVTCADNVTVSNVKDQTPTTAQIGIARDGTNLGQQMVLYGLSNSPSGSRTLTATFSGTATSNRGIGAAEASGLASPIVFAGTAGNDSGAGTATSFDSTTVVVPSAIGAMILAWAEGGSNLPAVAGGFISLFGETTNNCTLAYLVQGAAIPVSPSFTLGVADQWNVVIAALAPAPAAGPALRPLRVGKGLRAPIGSAQPSAPPSSTATYTLAAAPGTYAVTGDAALTPVAVFIGGASGTYALTGAAAKLTLGHPLTASPGSYAVTGAAAKLPIGRKLGLSVGSYVIAGQSATLRVGWKLGVTAGSYVLTGDPALLTASSGPAQYTLVATAASYSLTGAAAKLPTARKLGIAAGSYAATGDSLLLRLAWHLESGAGAFAITGDAASLTTASNVFRVPAQQQHVSRTAPAQTDALDAGPGTSAVAAGATAHAVTAPASQGTVSGDNSSTVTRTP